MPRVWLLKVLNSDSDESPRAQSHGSLYYFTCGHLRCAMYMSCSYPGTCFRPGLLSSLHLAMGSVAVSLSPLGTYLRCAVHTKDLSNHYHDIVGRERDSVCAQLQCSCAFLSERRSRQARKTPISMLDVMEFSHATCNAVQSRWAQAFVCA